MSWPPGRGLGCWFSLLLRGPGWSSCPRAGAKGVQLRDRALTTPLGVVVPGSRSIECIWGVWVWVPCPFLCVYMWGEGVYIRFACMRVGTFACVYGCLFVYVYVSGRALDSTSLIISVDPHPTTMPCRWRMPPVRWWFLAPGQDARVSAGPLSAVAWRGLALLALLGPDWGVGGLWVSGPRARSALVWSTAGGACGLCRHGTLGRLHCGCRRSHLRALLCPFLGGGRGCPAVVLLGVPCPGGPRMFGARIFSMPASCLAGWGCCSPHTLLNIYMEEPYEHKRDHTHRCTLKHSHWCKNRCSQTPIVLICCCFKTYFVILVRCAAQ